MWSSSFKDPPARIWSSSPMWAERRPLRTLRWPSSPGGTCPVFSLELSLSADASRGPLASIRNGGAVSSGHKEVLVTHFEKITREEIARRNYTEGTTRAYLRALHDLAGYFQLPPERLTPAQIREYSAHLISDRKLSGNTVNQMV